MGQNSDEGAGDVPKLLLKLEMLALNFGESLSLSPLFLELERDVEALSTSHRPFWRVEREEYRRRLRRLARRVSGWQLSALSTGGKLFEFDVPTTIVTDGKHYLWPDDLLQELRVADKDKMTQKEVDEWLDSEKARLGDQKLDGITRSFTATFSKANPDRKKVHVALEIRETAGDATEIEFDLDFFNFPMINNTRLSKNQRFALVMERFDKQSIKIVGILFPGLYASERDKPFLNDLIDQLRKVRAEETSEGAPPTP